MTAAGASPAARSKNFPLAWRDVRFTSRFTPFRHLAFFPEQAANWDWLDGRIRALVRERKDGPRPKILNLFGYTGVASLACAAAGAEVTHVDASKKSVAWARENAELSGMADRPSAGSSRTPAKMWRARSGAVRNTTASSSTRPIQGGVRPARSRRLFEDLPGLVTDCAALLSDDASFLLLNAYAARISGLSLAHVMAEATATRGGRIDWGELALAEDGRDGRAIGLSFFSRWSDR